MPSNCFSRIRGTTNWTVGRHARRSSRRVSIDVENQISKPCWSWRYSLEVRSATCDSGRNDSLRSPSPAASTRSSEASVHTALWWDSMTPFGGPVVPDV
jgi:hypothetical protein